MKTKIKYTILAAFATVLFATACKKNDDNNNTNPVARLKSITRAPSGVIDTLFYDASGRIARIKSTSTGGYQSFVYTTDSVIVYTKSGTDSTRSMAYKLNGLGLAIASATPPLSTASYTYDASNYEIYSSTAGFLGSSANDTFVISNGNVIEHRSLANNIVGYTAVKQTYDYFTDKSNTLTNSARGMGFLGNSSNNLVSKERYYSISTFPSTTIETHTYNYNYDYNSNGWVTKMTRTDSATSVVNTESYTYY